MNVLPILNASTAHGIDYTKVTDVLKYPASPGVTIVILKPGQDVLDHTHTAAAKTILVGTNGNMVYIDPPNSFKSTKTTHLVSPNSPMYETCREVIESEAPFTYPEIAWKNS